MKAETARKRERRLAEAKRTMRSRYSEGDLDLHAVAEEVGVSPRELQRAFENAGETFRGQLLKIRMERAHDLLSRPRNPLPIRAAAPQVGYRQASGLRQAFRRYYGINPSEVQADPPEYLGDVTFQSPSRD